MELGPEASVTTAEPMTQLPVVAPLTPALPAVRAAYKFLRMDAAPVNTAPLAVLPTAPPDNLEAALQVMHCRCLKQNKFYAWDNRAPTILSALFPASSVTTMRRFNNTFSHLNGFVLVGFCEWPRLEIVLFVVISIFYIMTLLGNSAIISLSCFDPRLHTPMYFFLANLSFLALCSTTSIVPQMLVNVRSHQRNISYIGYIAQLLIFLGLGSTQCVLLSVMAFDRYVAICQPLHYTVTTHFWLCHQLEAVGLVTGFKNSLVQTVSTLLLPRCGQYQVENFFCEVPAMLELPYVDTWINEVEMYAAVVVIKVIPIGLILFPYINIVRAVVRIQSSEGRKNAFNTCGSHLLVVFMFYGSAINGYAYTAPKSNSAKLKGKHLALSYGLITPMLNPLIYTLRNKDVKGAVRSFWGENKSKDGTWLRRMKSSYNSNSTLPECQWATASIPLTPKLQWLIVTIITYVFHRK
ncbi:PREDICTED: putative olfactory receptor 2B8 [Ceratotherium simum simum]|uniref:Olfactory receptor 2B8 n=1 Tax=Ceratotherium simum simum TaxID=73337 RepID=A0ABM1DIW8_CERSS|nr:PREDICTED: putative olfactory receptor 2B8 [Ceratotherium simum simum]